MKKIYTVVIAGILFTATVFAQAPEKMSYQAVVRNASNNLTTNQAVGMQISILQTTATGIAVYVETQTPTTNANGLVSLEIGTGTVVAGDFNTIDWANDTYFIKTETDPTGGTAYTITGTNQLMSVPYALHAKTAESITGTVNYTETDPVFGASIANGITATDTANWNNHTVDTDTQLDSIGVTSLGFVAGAHTINTDAQNLIVSTTGDTLTISGGNSVLVPGISLLNFPPAIGDFREGGVVFWLDGSGGGLVCSISDQSTEIQWYNGSNITTGATGITIGTGQANTTAIIANQGATQTNYAAGLAKSYTGGGYTDWFLPSKDELIEMYNNRAIINTTAIENSGTALSESTSTPFGIYWSSTEFDSNNAWHYRFYIGNSTINGKNLTYRVRAVRAF